MTRYVTRVVLSRSDESTRQNIPPMPGRELFRVAWTLNEPGAGSQDFAQSHHTLSAAQAHALNLLKRIRRGASIFDVYVENLDRAAASARPTHLAERCVCGHPTHPSQFCSCGCSISEIDNGRDASASHPTVSHGM